MPPAIAVGTYPNGSPEWHAARARSIGGSEVAAILGLSPWQSPFSLWHAKNAGWVTDPTPEMEWGHYLEPALRSWLQDHRADYGLSMVLQDSATYVRDGWRHANVDGRALTVEGALDIVECKKAGEEWEEVPPHYRVQAVWYMDVLGAARTWFVVSHHGRAPVVYSVDYDPDEARLIRGHAAAFWRSIRHDQPPPLDGHDATYQAVRRLHPDIDGTTVDVAPPLVEAFWEAKTKFATAASLWNEARSAMGAAMGAAQYATHQGVRVARRQTTKGGVPYVVAI